MVGYSSGLVGVASDGREGRVGRRLPSVTAAVRLMLVDLPLNMEENAFALVAVDGLVEEGECVEGFLVAVSPVAVFAWVHDAQTLPIFSSVRLYRAVSPRVVDERVLLVSQSCMKSPKTTAI